MTDVTTAASSAVEAPIAVVEATKPETRMVPLDKLSDEQRHNWLKTGDVPREEIQPSSDDSATSKPGAKSDAKAAESGTAKQSKSSTADKNWRELESDRNRERERAEKAEARLKELEAGKTGDKESEAKVSAIPERPEAPVKPKRADYESDELYEKAYEEEYLPKKMAFDAATKAFEKHMEQIGKRTDALNAKWKGIKEEGEKLYGSDGWKKAAEAFEAHSIYQGDPFEVYVRESTPEIGAHFMQYMSLKPKDVERITALPVGQQWTEFRAIEQAMREELELDEKKPKAEEPKPKPKVVSSALPPPAVVGGTGTTPEDEEKAALRASKEGNPGPYMALMNRRDATKRKSSRR
jgi:hypothetical protein